MNDAALSAWTPRVLSILRIMAALLFMQHGTQKLLDFPLPGPDPIPPLIMVAGLIELIGGAVLAVGLFSRWTAFLLSGMAAAAYFVGHASNGFFPIVNKGELAALYSFTFLYLFFAGPGPWSVDAMRGRR